MKLGSAQESRARGKERKHKKYSTNYLMILVKFLFVVGFLESYHLYQYLGSDSFLITTLSMIKEAATITN